MKDIKSSDNARIWSMPTLAFMALLVVAVVSGLVFSISKRSLYDELEYTIVIVAIVLFIVLQYGLYMGIRIRGKPRAPRFNALEKAFEAFELSYGLEILELLGPIFAWIGMTIAILIGLVFFATLLWSAALLFGFVLYWLLYRAFRIALLKGSICKGDIWLSFKYSALYTLLYSGWLFGIVWLAEHQPWIR